MSVKNIVFPTNVLDQSWPFPFVAGISLADNVHLGSDDNEGMALVDARNSNFDEEEWIRVIQLLKTLHEYWTGDTDTEDDSETFQYSIDMRAYTKNFC
jgi:hypothetical protein